MQDKQIVSLAKMFLSSPFRNAQNTVSVETLKKIFGDTVEVCILMYNINYADSEDDSVLYTSVQNQLNWEEVPTETLNDLWAIQSYVHVQTHFQHHAGAVVHQHTNLKFKILIRFPAQASQPPSVVKLLALGQELYEKALAKAEEDERRRQDKRVASAEKKKISEKTRLAKLEKEAAELRAKLQGNSQ